MNNDNQHENHMGSHRHSSWLFPWIFPILFPLLFPILFPMIFMMTFGWGRMGHWGGNWNWNPMIDQRNPISIERTQTPLEFLQTRYAKGEITKEQYEQMKKDIE